MKKLINLLLVLLLALAWGEYFKKEDSNKKQFNSYLARADKYYAMKADIDSYKEYESSEKYASDDQKEYVLGRKMHILLRQDEYLKARRQIDNAYIAGINIGEAGSIFLEACLKNEKYKEMNDFIYNYRDKIDLSNFEDKIFTKFRELGAYDEVKQVGQDMFLLSDQARKYIVDADGRRLFTSYYSDVIGFDEKNKLVTVVDGKEKLLVDFKKNVRAKLLDGNIDYFMDGSYILKDKKYHLNNQLNEKILEADYIGRPDDGKRVVISKNKLEILDGDNKKIDQIDLKKLEPSPYNYELKGGILRIKDGKARLYKLGEKIYSKAYDDIKMGDQGYIAVKKDGKWAYIDDNFNELTAFIYDNAEAYSNGLGFVEIDGRRYFIDNAFKIVDTCDFEAYIPFNKRGVGFIKKKEKWKMIKLIRKDT